MTYVQLSLLHLPAIVVLGDALRLTTEATWFTPAHVMGGWNHRLKLGRDYDAGAWWREWTLAQRADFAIRNGIDLHAVRDPVPSPEVLAAQARMPEVKAAE
jgi:hypothetical protein